MRKPAAFVAGTSMLCLALFLAVPTTVRANEQVYNSLLPATVWVKADLGPGQTSFGSGVLVDAQRRWVVTNYHVVEEQSKVRVFFPVHHKGDLLVQRNYYANNESSLAIPGRVIIRDNQKDLAVIELERLPQDVRAVRMASASPHNAQDLHVIGNPKGSALWVYTAGKVRTVYDKAWNVALENGKIMFLNARVVETDLAINPGDSGGPVVNNGAELVALVSSYQKDQRLVSTCIDISEVRGILARAQAGVQVAQASGLPGGIGEDNPKSIPGGGDKGNPKADPRVGKLLDQTEFNGKYKITPEGTYKIDVKPGSPPVYIESFVNNYKGSSVRRVWAMAKVYDNPPPADLNLKLLMSNSSRILGAWGILRLKNTTKFALMFSRKVPVNATAADLQATIDFVHGEADDLALGKALQGVDLAGLDKQPGPDPGPGPGPGPDPNPGAEKVPPGQFSLAGTWKAVSFANNTKIDWTMMVDKKAMSLKVDNGLGNPQTVKGTYSLEDNKLAIVAGDKANALGKLTWVNANSFTVDDGTLKLTFNRANAGVVVGPGVGAAKSVSGTTWTGKENLQNFGKLTFVFKGNGDAIMIDAQSTVHGKWAQKGNQVTVTFQNCVYEGTINGQIMAGNARFTQGGAGNWKWDLKLQAGGQ